MCDDQRRVVDPLTDYDIFDPDFVVDPFPVMDAIRESGCPIAHSDRWGGSWLPTRYADVVAMAQEYDVFTSSTGSSRRGRPTQPPTTRSRSPSVSSPRCSASRPR